MVGGMVGGMSMINPQFENDDYEGIVPPVLYGVKIKYDDDNNVINTDEIWLNENVFNIMKKINDDKENIENDKLTDKEIDYAERNILNNENVVKKNIMNEYARLEDIISSRTTEDRYENEKIIQDIKRKKNELIQLYSFYFNYNDKNITKDELDSYTENINKKSNKAYDKIYNEAKEIEKNDNTIKSIFEKGNISEQIIGTDRDILLSVDGDRTKQNNSKDKNVYNQSFIDLLEELWKDENYKEKTINNLKTNLKPDEQKAINNIDNWSSDDFINYSLQFFPIDIIKKNTVWELKNHDTIITNPQNNQFYAKTKILGYEPDFNRLNIGFDILYKNINGKNRLYNIIAKTPRGLVETLKDNPKGYNYYTFFFNKDKSGYFNNTLNTNNFKNDEDNTKNIKKMYNSLKSDKDFSKEYNDKSFFNEVDERNYNVYKKMLKNNVFYGKLNVDNFKDKKGIVDESRYSITTKNINSYPSTLINTDNILKKFDRKINLYKKKKI